MKNSIKIVSKEITFCTAWLHKQFPLDNNISSCDLQSQSVEAGSNGDRRLQWRMNANNTRIDISILLPRALCEWRKKTMAEFVDFYSFLRSQFFLIRTRKNYSQAGLDNLTFFTGENSSTIISDLYVCVLIYIQEVHWKLCALRQSILMFVVCEQNVARHQFMRPELRKSFVKSGISIFFLSVKNQIKPFPFSMFSHKNPSCAFVKVPPVCTFNITAISDLVLSLYMMRFLQNPKKGL